MGKTKKSGLSRRTFLQITGAAAAATWAGCAPKDDGKEVVVIGAGLGGLSAAYELQKLGYRVTILEAQERVGGRVLTEREGFGGAWAEMGAVRVPDSHAFTNRYIKELGLELVEYPSNSPVYYINGQRFFHKDGQKWPLDLTAEEQIAGPDTWYDYVGRSFDDIGDATRPPWPSLVAREKYDGLTVTEYLKQQGASDDFLRLGRADNGGEIDTFNALLWLGAEWIDRTWDKTLGIKGGNDLLPQAFAAKLDGKIKLGSVVTRIAYDQSGAKVVYTDTLKKKVETIYADHLVVAIPFTTLRKVQIIPELPRDKMHIIKTIAYQPAGRVHVQTKRRFWQDEGISGLKIVKGDSVIERVWDLSSIQPGDTGLLQAYMQASNAEKVRAVPADQRIQFVIDEMTKIFPTLPTQLQGGTAQKMWVEDPWVQGGWPAYQAGEGAAQFPVMGRAEGRLHFAGEHTSIWTGWMNGALESGVRVVREISGMQV
jgi:monoamine oxidase